MEKEMTRRKMIRNAVVYCAVLVLSTFYIKYFKDPKSAYDIDSYIPPLTGAIIAYIFIFIISKKKNPGNLDTKLTDERDEMIAYKYNSLALPVILFYIPVFFLFIAIPLKIESISVGNLSIVLLLMMASYAIGFWLYRNAKS